MTKIKNIDLDGNNFTSYKALVLQFKKGKFNFYIFRNNMERLFGSEVREKTPFLDEYNVSFAERLWYILNDVNELQRCPYCGKKKAWSGRIAEGYKKTCGDKECVLAAFRDSVKGKGKPKADTESNPKVKKFIAMQLNLKKNEINDQFIIDTFFSKKGLDKSLVNFIRNSDLVDYLDNRFTDSESTEETLKRINLHIEEKPKCPECGKPVHFIGKPNHMFTKFCSVACRAKNKDVLAMREATDKAEHGGVLGWVKSNSDPDKIQKRLDTLKEKYNTTNAHKAHDIKKLNGENEESLF